VRPAGHEQRSERTQSDCDSPCKLHFLLPSWGPPYDVPYRSEPHTGDMAEYRGTPTWGTRWGNGLRKSMYLPAPGCFR
jgi:hypothetical protein